MGDIGFDRVMALIADWADADWPACRTRPGINASLRVGVDRQKLLPVPAIGVARQHDLAGTAALRGNFVHSGTGQVEPGQTIKRVAPPGPVIDLVAHGFAKLAVARHIDPAFRLPAHDIDDGSAQRLLESA